MKFSVDRAVLLKALAHVQSVVERRNTIPILANVLLEARESGLKLTATDMEIAVVEDVPGVTVTRQGRTTADRVGRAILVIDASPCRVKIGAF
jgi:DNA polymerase-3 subunit beta